MLLNGQLSEYPLLTLFEIFQHKRATGRLDITCPEASGEFYFLSGELKIATMGKLKDNQALEFATNLKDAAFNFSTLQPVEFAQAAWVQAFRPPRESLLSAHGIWTKAVSFLPQRRPVPIEATNLPSQMAEPSAYSLISATKLAQASESIEWQSETKSLVAPNDVAASLGLVKTSTPAIRTPPPQLSSKQQSARNKALAAVLGLVLIVAVVIGTALSFYQSKNSPASAANPSPVKQAPVVVPPSVSTAASPDFAAPEKLEEPMPSPMLSEEHFAPILEQTAATKSITNKTERRPSTGEYEAPDAVVVNNQATPDDTATPTAAAAKVTGVETSKPKTQPGGKQSVEVVLQIEDGRVVQASVLNHRPQLAPYEAAALRLARQRRYPEATKRKETIVIEVNQPD